MSGTSPAVLMLADISGYTQFMRLHAVSTLHARQVIVRLLEALVRASGPPLHVAELEGDAIFFYAPATPATLDDIAARVKAQIPRLFRVFKQEIRALTSVHMCVCDACTTAGNLRLKQVVHTGEIAIERIGQFEKLFGIDVIVVHRMLKNSVPAHEYLMLTEPAYAAIGGFLPGQPERRTENFEGVGEVETVVFYEDQLADAVANAADLPPAPTRSQVVGFNLRMLGRTLRDLATGRLRRRPAG